MLVYLAAASATPDSSFSNQAVRFFIDACVDGSAHMPVDAVAVPYTSLPATIRSWWKKPPSGKFIKFGPRSDNYLISYEQVPVGDKYVRVCALASRQIDLGNAAFEVTKVITGSMPTPDESKRIGRFSTLVLSRPDEGYEFSARKVRGYVALQVSFLNPIQIETMKRQRAAAMAKAAKQQGKRRIP